MTNITYELIAHSGVTPIPEGIGNFTLLGQKPAVDSQGNVLFTGVGGATPTDNFQSGLYRFNGAAQKVAARGDVAPSGENFTVFYGSDFNDINEAAAFLANTAPWGKKIGLFVHDAGMLEQVDGITDIGFPSVNGGVVAVRCKKDGVVRILRSPGGFVEPGSGYSIALNTQVAIDGAATIFRRYNSSASQLAIHEAGGYDIVASLNDGAPGGGVFTYLSFFPALSGRNAAFTANTSLGRGIYKRTGGLELVADTQTLVPGSEQIFYGFDEGSVGIVGDVVAFQGNLPSFGRGIYTDVDGVLQAVAETGKPLDLGGKSVELKDLSFSGKGFALTAQGYEFVFFGVLADNSYAIIRATIPSDAAPPPPPPPPPEPDPDYAVTVDGSAVSLASTRGAVTQVSPGKFEIAEADGVRTLVVRVV